VHWSVRTAETCLAGLAGIAVLIAAVFADTPGRFLGAVGGVGLLVLAATDVAWRPRLAANGGGLLVRTPGRTAQLPWAAVTAVRVDERQRLGRTQRTLEIDAGDDLIILGRRSLGTDPRDVAALLTALRPD
jgi:PH (Pleckstrin Homology) domain-containing protein